MDVKGMLVLVANGVPWELVPVASAEQASALLVEWRDRHNLRSSEFKRKTGWVVSEDRTIAHVSYNGRVWAGHPKNWTTDSTPIWPEGN